MDEAVVGAMPPELFRARMRDVSALERDRFFDAWLGTPAMPSLDERLPPGAVPYLPCTVNDLMLAADLLNLDEASHIVDIGAGLGRTALFLHLWLGARTTGIELQGELVRLGRAWLRRFNSERIELLQGDATTLPGASASADAFVLYCPFGRDAAGQFLETLDRTSGVQTRLVAAIDMSLPARPWLQEQAAERGVTIYRCALR